MCARAFICRSLSELLVVFGFDEAVACGFNDRSRDDLKGSGANRERGPDGGGGARFLPLRSQHCIPDRRRSLAFEPERAQGKLAFVNTTEQFNAGYQWERIRNF
jgi:hypothetical protein